MSALPRAGVSGVHLLADLHGLDAAPLTDAVLLEALMRDAARAAGAQCLGSNFHTFGTALGITGVVLLAESHLSVHTWPEHGYAAFDIFMCGSARPHAALTVLVAALRPRRQDVREITRGDGPTRLNQ